MGWILQVVFFFFYKCQKTLKWQSKFRKDIQKDASDANTSRSEVIWITGTEKANEKVTNFFFFLCSGKVLPSVYTLISANVETCLHIQGQVLLVSSSNTYHFLKQKLFPNTQTVEVCHIYTVKGLTFRRHQSLVNACSNI